MKMNVTTSKIGRTSALALVSLILVSMLTAPVSAGASTVEAGNSQSGDITVTEGGDGTTVNISVTADSAGISGETLKVDVVDNDTDDIVSTVTGPVDQSAGTTSTYPVPISGPDESGEYSIEPHVNGTQIASPINMTVEESESVSVASSQDDIAEIQGQTVYPTFNLSSVSGVSNGSLSVEVIDTRDGSVVSTDDVTVDLTAGESKQKDVSVPVPQPGKYKVDAQFDGAVTNDSVQLTAKQNAQVDLDQADYEVGPDGSVTITADLSTVPDTVDSVTGQVYLEVSGDDSMTVFDSTVTVPGSGATETWSYTLDNSAENLQAGNYSVSVTWGSGNAAANLTVEDEAILGGGGSDGDDNSSIIDGMRDPLILFGAFSSILGILFLAYREW